MSVELHNTVLVMLRSAYEAFIKQDEKVYYEKMREAEANIKAIESLGVPMDGSTGRPLEVLLLTGEWNLIAALPELSKPLEALARYRMADIELIGYYKSKILHMEDPWLPNPVSLLDFFREEGKREEDTAKELTLAADAYQKLTGGGGGVATMYRAELEASLGRHDAAAVLAKKALSEMTGDRWMTAIADRLRSPSGCCP